MAQMNLLAHARQYWAERNLRERRMLVAMVVVISVAILWALFDWQASERKRLDKLSPRVQAQVKSMQDDAAELARLRVAAKPATQDIALVVESLKSSAATQNLAITVRGDGDRILVSAASVPFDTWVTWLAGVQAQNALRVSALEATPANEGQRIEARLVQAR